MDITFVPTPQDANLKIEAAITKSAAFAGTSFDWGSGFAPGGLGQPTALVANLSGLAGTGTLTLTPTESSDNATFTACGPAVIIAQGGSLTIGTSLLAGVLSVPCFLSKRYFKGSLGLAGSATITLDAYLKPLAPLL